MLSVAVLVSVTKDHHKKSDSYRGSRKEQYLNWPVNYDLGCEGGYQHRIPVDKQHSVDLEQNHDHLADQDRLHQLKRSLLAAKVDTHQPTNRRRYEQVRKSGESKFSVLHGHHHEHQKA